MKNCQICNQNNWQMLPDPHPTQSVTTAGVIIQQPLNKAFCFTCGFTQRGSIEWLAFSKYYEGQYENYYNRPGTEKYHEARYVAIVEWMSDFIDPDKHHTALDVGCGQGWAMKILKKKFPHMEVKGLEPSGYNSIYAKNLGFDVYEGRLNDHFEKMGQFDLVFSNNVIQHVDDAYDFLMQLKSLVKPNGILIITSPDGSIPNIEMLWSDQNYSFLPSNFIALAQRAGFTILDCSRSPVSKALPHAIRLVLSLNETDKPVVNSDIKNDSLDVIYSHKKNYLDALAKQNYYLSEMTSQFDKVFNFGSSYWTSILAGYAPEYWSKVEACIIDDGDTENLFMGKKVLLNNEVNRGINDAIIIGVNPDIQKTIKDRLSKQWNHVLTWTL